jgi:hypothetical protein
MLVLVVLSTASLTAGLFLAVLERASPTLGGHSPPCGGPLYFLGRRRDLSFAFLHHDYSIHYNRLVASLFP